MLGYDNSGDSQLLIWDLVSTANQLILIDKQAPEAEALFEITYVDQKSLLLELHHSLVGRYSKPLNFRHNLFKDKQINKSFSRSISLRIIAIIIW
jgi:hypothetical protein